MTAFLLCHLTETNTKHQFNSSNTVNNSTKNDDAHPHR